MATSVRERIAREWQPIQPNTSKLWKGASKMINIL